MIDVPEPLEFDWDEGNLHKSYKKHGISPNQAEQVFTDTSLIILQNVKHSQKEERFTAIGKTDDQRILFIVYTIRRNKVRIISARPAAKSERRLYEKIKKNTAL